MPDFKTSEFNVTDYLVRGLGHAYQGIKVRCAKLHQMVTTNEPTPSFLQVRCLSCHPTNSIGVMKGKSITFHGLAYTNLICGPSTLFRTIKRFWLPWGNVAKPCISPLTLVYRP